MNKWSAEKAHEWYKNQEWLIGANFLPSSAINQLEMFQPETFDEHTIKTELKMASALGFNSMRVYLHDLLWDIKPMIVLFDDCHRSNPKLGKQFLPLKGIHNSGWSQSPGHEIVKEIHEGKLDQLPRLKKFIQEVLSLYSEDERILLWDIYNEPGQFGIGENSIELLQHVWDWALEVRPSQPLTNKKTSYMH
jgi:hypothetical protein